MKKKQKKPLVHEHELIALLEQMSTIDRIEMLLMSIYFLMRQKWREVMASGKYLGWIVLYFILSVESKRDVIRKFGQCCGGDEPDSVSPEGQNV